MNQKNITTEKKCRVCGEEIKDLMDFGKLYPSGFINKDIKLSESDKVPLVLSQCTACGLVQLKHTVDLDLMYRQYWYSSSLNKSMVSSLRNVVEDVEERINLDGDDIVVDIGCNDGTMLSLYKPTGAKLVGYDPALNLKRNEDIIFINDYFSKDIYLELFGQLKAKVITAIAMLYDLPSPTKFVFDVKEILHENGIFVIQFTDLLSMFKATAFDNVCHEHLEYYRLKDIKNIFDICGLEIIDISYNDVNGGSLRVTAAHPGRYIPADGVKNSLRDEEDFLNFYTFDKFKESIETCKRKTVGFLKWIRDKKERAHILGASTKGNTFLQVCGIDNSMVDFAAEINEDKFGLKTVGSNIEIISETESLIKHPEYYIVPVWHFKDSILKNSAIVDYLNSGGSLVFPLPEFTVATMSYDKTITETRI